ncbi:hypothetical protein K435DRAFT_291264 [Dendrothele bispora CBS 962.96]|uniref:Uncharacterized protein n=1 Tax=Dendrothele bispora (strain CBS 962.96) TaxID=1314807 RepID=A0A4S8LK85_DENBC|nr:hypothetical protein K435DRAFT_291264 [Dendrothele bispora CBS 962.96]
MARLSWRMGSSGRVTLSCSLFSFSRCWSLAVPCQSTISISMYIFPYISLFRVPVPVLIFGFHYLLRFSVSKRRLESSVLFQKI